MSNYASLESIILLHKLQLAKVVTVCKARVLVGKSYDK